MQNTKPLIAAAFFCEKIQLEKDDVASIVRIIDKIYVPRERPDDAMIQVTMFAGVKSGALKGKGEMSFVARGPSLEDGRTIGPFPVLLNGDEHGAQFNLQFAVPTKLGLYWFDVMWNEELLTSVPLRLAETEE